MKIMIIKYLKMNKIKIPLLIAAIGFIVAAIFVCANNSHPSVNENYYLKADSIHRVTILAVGDAMAHMPQQNSAKQSDSEIYDFQSVFQFIEPLVKSADISIVNYETNAAGKPYSGYPRFSAPDTFIYALKDVGFNFFINANNHSADKGYVGLTRTIEVMEQWNIEHTGTFKNKNERKKHYPFIKKINGMRIAILNYTYGINGNLLPKGTVINEIDTIQMAIDIKKAKDSLSDAIVACLHWGVEDQRKPNHEQKATADFLFRQGVDVIVGSHPHTVQSMEWRKNSKLNKNQLVFWSLGNFVSNQRKRYNDGGLIVLFDVVKNIKENTVYIENARYVPFWVMKTAFPIKYFVLPVNQTINDTCNLRWNTELREAFNTFKEDTKALLSLDTNQFKEL